VILFYPAKCNNDLNRRPFSPDEWTGRAMVNPLRRVRLHPATLAGCDSGGYQDSDVRLLVFDALQRQLAYESWLSWQVTGAPDWHFEFLVTYDRRIMGDPNPKVDQTLTLPAVHETLANAAYYASQRHRIRGRICFAAQGVNPDQYVRDCVTPMLDVMQPGDYFAFGGFAPAGKIPRLKPLFRETVARTLPLLKKRGIPRAHLLGICTADLIQFAAALGRQHEIEISTDSSSMEVNSVMGRVWSAGRWEQRYSRAQKYIDYHPRDLAHANIAAYTQWSKSL
jgi:hypothetical protein